MTTLQTVRLSYAEFAEKLGISLEAAKQRARRGGWRRETGNDGQVYTWVPEEALKATPTPQNDTTNSVTTEPERSHDIATTALVQALQAATQRADEAEKATRDAITKAGESEARAAIAETRADRVEKDITELRRRYERNSGLSGRIIRFLAGN